MVCREGAHRQIGAGRVPGASARCGSPRRAARLARTSPVAGGRGPGREAPRPGGGPGSPNRAPRRRQSLLNLAGLQLRLRLLRPRVPAPWRATTSLTSRSCRP